jgi:polysaccharide biosynthesis transport protein
MHQSKVSIDSRLTMRPEDADQFIDIDRLLAMARRRLPLVTLFAAAGLVLGALFLAFTPPTYTAATRILLDENLTKFAEEREMRPAPNQADAMVASEVEILKSARLARVVVSALDLQDNESFLEPPRSPAGWLRSQLRAVAALFGSSAPRSGSPTEEARVGRAAAMLQQNLVAERVGRSFVIEVKYSAKDRELAGAIARTYADRYLSDQLDANFDATQRATVWLQGRLTELRNDWLTASLEAERFRAENGLTAARGELVSEQQLSDLNNQLILAQAETANALARYNQYSSIIDSGEENAVRNAIIPTDIANSSVLNELKSRYLAMTEREQEIASRFGEDHPQAVTLRRQAADLRRQIFQELQQVTESYRNEYEVARAREASLRENVGTMAGESSATGQSLVKLREMEQQSAALGTLYETFLARYEEASQQQSFPIAEARVISEANNPVRPSSPSKTMVLGLSLVLGLFAGAGMGGLMEFRERFLRTGDEARAALGVDFLGYLPLLGTPAGRRKKARSHADRDEGALGDGGAGLLRVAVDAPSSLFADTLRSAKLAGDVLLHQKASKIIGFASVLPREGKTTAAANFAGLLAANGSRTLLIDADLRNPGLSRRLAVSPENGLVEALVGQVAWQNTVLVDQKTQLSIIPALLRGRMPHTSELISGPRMRKLLEEARGFYDYVVVDLPPLGPVVDARAFAPLADGFIFVAEWGATPRALLRSTLQSEPQIASKMLGLLLNKTDMKSLAKYGAPGGSERYFDRYAAYYGQGAERAG